MMEACKFTLVKLSNLRLGLPPSAEVLGIVRSLHVGLWSGKKPLYYAASMMAHPAVRNLNNFSAMITFSPLSHSLGRKLGQGRLGEIASPDREVRSG